MLRLGGRLSYTEYGSFYIINNLVQINKMNILFVCTGNICRSPMAEGYFNFLCSDLGKSYKAESAGIYTENNLSASQNAVSAMLDLDIDISNHKSRRITETIVNNADLIIVMTKSHKKALISYFHIDSSRIFLLHKFDGLDKDVFDPYGGDLKTYKVCFNDMKKALDNLFLDVDKF